MKIFAAIITAGILVSGLAFATIYKFTDDSGQVQYTNVLSSVPADKLKDITELEEYESDVPERSYPSSEPTSPSPNQVDSDKEALIVKKREQRKKIETEYNTLLKEKRDLDNNKSFQKRRKKKKYQNRPYIQELIKKEDQLLNQLSELEAKLKTFGKQ